MGGIDWRSRTLWFRIGYALTAAWMIFVVLATGNDVTHTLFQYIFAAPLAAWIVGLIAARLARRLWPPPS